MVQKMDSATRGMLEEFPAHVYVSQVNENCEVHENDKPSLEEQSSILENNIEKYQLIFAEYENERTDNCDNQFQEFSTDIYSVNTNGTQHEISDSQMPCGIQELTHEDVACETEISNTVTDSQIVKHNEADIGDSKSVQGAKEIVSCDTKKEREGRNVDSTVEPAILEGKSDVLKPAGKKFYIELNEKTIFALHGLDVSLPVSCDICQLDFVSMSKFDDHMRQHLETRSFMCQLCFKTYISWQNLVAHRKVCHNGQFISCDGCAHRKHHLNLHPVSFPTGDFPVGCEECHEGFRNASELNRHYRCHAVDAVDKHENVNDEKILEDQCKQPTENNDIPNDIDVTLHEDHKFYKKNKEFEDVPRTTNSSKRKLCENEMLSFSDFNDHKKLRVELNVSQRHSLRRKMVNDRMVLKKYVVKQRKQHQCKICFKKFNSTPLFIAHKFVHPAIEKFRCFNCQMEFNTRDDLAHHITKVHYQCPEIKLICDICTTNHPVHEFMSHYLLCQDKEKSQKTGKLDVAICEVCDHILPNPEALQYHMRKHNSVKQSYLCDICGKIIQNADILISHMHSHRKEKFSEVNVTVKGSKEGNEESIKTVKCFMCEYCGREFKNRMNLQLHIRRHTGEKPYQCRQCPMAFYTGQQLSAHQCRHRGEGSYFCTVCQKSFSSATMLYAHKRRHGKQYTCHICEKKILGPATYQDHMQTHSRVHPYKCNECSKTFLLKSRLLMHKKSHEDGKINQMKHQCSDCGQSFTSAQELENHHEEKCYLTMITFMSPSSDENKESSPLIFVNANNNPNIIVEEQKSYLK